MFSMSNEAYVLRFRHFCWLAGGAERLTLSAYYIAPFGQNGTKLLKYICVKLGEKVCVYVCVSVC